MRVPIPVLSAHRPVHGHPPALWWLPREAARNWLALGLLLGAWNVVDDGSSLHRRPKPLRGYEAVSVRALHRTHANGALSDGHNSVKPL